jgi:Restriction Endonuclease associating with ARP
MALNASWYITQLRQELGLRNQWHARGRAYVESYGSSPVIVYAPENCRHGNFFDPAYTAITERPEWMRRFGKIHAQASRSLPRPTLEPDRRWRELDSSMSSDALLMNVFCTPGVADSGMVRNTLGNEGNAVPAFGWKAHVPLATGRSDRTEVDMRLGDLLVEAKLTENDFQICKAEIVEAYRDFEVVFDRQLLPRLQLSPKRRKAPSEFPEAYSQEFESLIDTSALTASIAFTGADSESNLETESGYASYQLIRNVLAAYAEGCCFCVLHDERRPDLREAWFKVIAAVKSSEMRVRLKVLTWQELAVVLPAELQEFLDLKYGIVPPGRTASPLAEVSDCS